MACFGGVAHVLIENDRFAVRVSDGRAAILLRQTGELLGWQIGVANLLRPGLRDIPVLTEFAVHVAARGGY